MHRLLADIPTCLETERLMLRCYEPGDGTWYYAMSRRNRAHLQRYESGNAAMFIEDVDDAEVTVRQFYADWVARSAFMLGAFRRDSGTFVAQIYVGVANWEAGTLVVGYFCDVDHVGQGYVTEATQGALRLIFGPLQGRRATIYCSDTNARSARVAERCGFTREGHLRDTHPAGAYPASGDYIYGLLRDEFVALGGAPLPGHIAAEQGVELRPLGSDEVARWTEIDRTELIESVYHLEDGDLVLHAERYDVQGWRQPAEERDQITADLQASLEHGGWPVGAWDGDRLVGIVVLDGRRLGPQQDQLQLKLLHVSHGYRDQGLGARLFEVARDEARRRGARDLYVSATPSEHTVRFYLGRGCRLNPTPDPALYAEEPEDIHLLCAV